MTFFSIPTRPKKKKNLQLIHLCGGGAGENGVLNWGNRTPPKKIVIYVCSEAIAEKSICVFERFVKKKNT